jgi:hypothetical protein
LLRIPATLHSNFFTHINPTSSSLPSSPLSDVNVSAAPLAAGFSLASAIDVDFVSNPPLREYAAEVLAALSIPLLPQNPVNWNGIFSTTREAIHSHPREWWVILWESLTHWRKFPKSVACRPGGGGHLAERYYHVFLDPGDEWENTLKFEQQQRCP